MKKFLPKATRALVQQQPDALFVDVRMEVEALYVGRPLGVHIIAGSEYPDLTPHAREFVCQVEREAGIKDRTMILICRSGKRTLDVDLALEAAGFSDVVNGAYGFEGDLDDTFHRATLNGRRFDGLTWEER